MPRRPAEQRDLKRIAFHPSTRAPSARELATPTPPPVVRTHRELAAAAELRDEVWNGDVLDYASLSGRAFVSLAGNLVPPLTRVRLVAVGAYLAELAASPHLTHLRALGLAGCRIGPAGLALLAASPHWAELVELGLADNDLVMLPAAFAQVSRLGLAGNPLAADALAGCRRLHALDLSRGPGPLPTFPAGVVELALNFRQMGDARLLTLLGSGALAGVRKLSLAGNRLTAAGLAPVLRLPHLEALDVSANFFGDDFARTLLSLRWVRAEHCPNVSPALRAELQARFGS